MGIWNKIISLFSPQKAEGKPRKIVPPAAPSRPARTLDSSDRLVNLNIHPSAAATSAAAPAPTQASSGTPIPYNSDLISILEQEHKNLLQLFTSIVTLATNQQHAQAQNQLKIFKTRLIEHLHLENLRLYVYLQYTLSKAPEKFTEMRRFRKEMDAIGKVAMGVFDKYEENPISSANHVEFLSELNHLGQVLGNRINQEERILYPMYRANKA